MDVKFLLKNIFYIILLAPTLLQAASDLELDVTKLSSESISEICPLLIDKNGEKIISDVSFSNEKVLLDKIPTENEPRRLLTTTVDNYIAKSNIILHKIKDKVIEIPDMAKKGRLMHKLNLNKSFLTKVFNDLYSKRIEMNSTFYITKFNGEAVVITQTKLHENELHIEYVMSDPDNILNTVLNTEGAIKRASVENIRSIARDAISNNPSITKMKSYVVSPTLEANYRRFGFTEFSCR
ncbi:hypothetical protein [Photobacterium leiognathi]|uniref:hypothetical protein n=1 Tax=Photobacterium leiognathi TaxID=553611 RepID=UPI002738DE5C|nr:hypothetical protein [Photobacterium leiognathi]